MNSQQAINLLKGLEQSLDDYCELNDEGKAAFRMAITALEPFGISEQLASKQDKYEYHYDHTDCIWYRQEARNRCPVTCAQYRDGWNDAMNYIFRDGKGYRPYRRDKKYEERREE